MGRRQAVEGAKRLGAIEHGYTSMGKAQATTASGDEAHRRTELGGQVGRKKSRKSSADDDQVDHLDPLGGCEKPSNSAYSRRMNSICCSVLPQATGRRPFHRS